MKYSGFTRSIWTYHTKGLPLSNLQVEVMKNFHFTVTGMKSFNF